MQCSVSSSSPIKENAQSGAPTLSGWQPAVIWLLRIAVGAVFVVSGLSKLVDPWGFIFKIEEYLAIWGYSEPRTVTLMGAMLISGYEFVLGFLLLMGCYKRVAPWGLLLTMIVMLPLTVWIWIADPVSDCGCFGEFIRIPNGATLLKNIFITAALVLLILWNGRLRLALFNPEIQWIVGAWITLYAIIVSLYGYNAQPMADFRSFPVGTSLLAERGTDDGDYRFVYEKNGEQEVFGIDEIPDSTWTFVNRLEPETDGEAHADEALAVFDGDEDVTADVIAGEGKELLLIIPEPRRADVTATYTVNEIYEYADSIGVPFIAILGGEERSVAMWRDISMAEYPIYTADDTQLKELARGAISLVTLDGSVVSSKTSVGSIDPVAVESPASPDAFFEELQGYGRRWFTLINIIFGGALLLLYLFQGIILAVRAKIRQAYRRKAAKNA